MHEKQKLLSMIRKYDFVLYELQLYLDTHPHSPEALRMWKNYQSMRQKAVSSYVRQFGPIQPMQAEGNDSWDWVKGPWPWEKEAN
ncbi:spore coat protein CotJB [Ruminococcus sp.]|uniref:spore coat protein CotJB n=1 Tax=Ruminococcus sp. TaxID=41978 RepID=UPI0025E6F102|nr:spore coat protein CotJB [Ruminococcus sp.]